MSRRSVLMMMLLFLAAGSVVMAGEGQSAEEKAQAEMQAWMELGTPGEHHKHLAQMEGAWNGEVKFWFAPDMEPQVSTGSFLSKFILGGRYLENEFKGEVSGMPFTGRGITAYDRIVEEYVDVWFDSMSTGIMISRGSCKDDGKVITFMGELIDPSTRGKVGIRSVYTFLDKDHFKVEMWNLLPDGTEFKSMEIAYTRK